MLFLSQIFLFFIIISLSNQECLPTTCEICSFDSYDINYQKFSKISLNLGLSLTKDKCVEKSQNFSSRQVLIENNNCSFYDTTTFDACYENIIDAFFGENGFALLFLHSAIKFVFATGIHYISKNDLKNSNPEFFRRSLINIDFLPFSSTNVTIVLETNEFFIFVSKILNIRNIIFIWGALPDTEHPLNENSEFYGFLNIEKIFDDFYENTPTIDIQNCSFSDFILLPKNGWRILFSLAPFFSGILQVNDTLIFNCSFSKSIIYYSKSTFDLLSEKLQNVAVINAIQIVSIYNSRFSNFYNLDSIEDRELGLICLQDFEGNATFVNSQFQNISLSQNIIFFNNEPNSLKGNISCFNLIFQNIIDTNLINIAYLVNLQIKNVEINNCLHDNSTKTFLIQGIQNPFNIHFISIFSMISSNCYAFEINDSIGGISNCDFSDIIMENFISISNSSIIFFNCSFEKFSLSTNLFTFSGSKTEISISYSFFALISGAQTLFYSSSMTILQLNQIFLKFLTVNSIFCLEFTLFNINFGLILTNSSFDSVWNYDNTCIITQNFKSLIQKNYISGKIIILFASIDMNFLFSAVHIRFNILTSNIMLRMLTGFGNFSETIITNNYFLNSDFFEFIMDFEIDNQIIMTSCHFQENGVIAKKKFYLSAFDNSLFLFFMISSTIFRNTVFAIGALNELTSGFFLGTPHTGYFELNACSLILFDRNPDFLYKFIILDHFAKAVFLNNRFYNMTCNDRDWYHSHGAIILTASSSFSYLENDYSVILHQNIFNCCECVHGSLVIIGISKIELINNSFYNSSNKFYGGHLLLAAGEIVIIDSLLLNNSKADEGAGIYLTGFSFVNITKLVVLDAFSRRNGVIFCKDILLLEFTDSIAFNLISLMNGAMFFFFQTTALITNLKLYGSYAFLNGGTADLQVDSTLQMQNSLINQSFASYGGSISLDHSLNFMVSNSSFLNCGSVNMGGVIYIDVFEIISIFNVFFSDSYANGNGVIYLKTTEEFPIFSVSNLTCLRTKSQKGSCLFYVAACKMNIVDLNIVENGYFPIFAFWSYAVDLNFERITVINTKIYESLIYFGGLNVQSNSWYFANNSAKFYFELANSNVTLENLNFENNNGEYLIFTEYSFLFTKKLSFSNNNSSKYYLNMVESQNSILILDEIMLLGCEASLAFFDVNGNNLNISNSCFLVNNNQILNLIDANLFIENSLFLNNTSDNDTPNDIYIEMNLQSFINFNLLNCTFHVKNGFSIKIYGNVKTFINFTTFIGFQDSHSIEANEILILAIGNSNFMNLNNGNLMLTNKITEQLAVFQVFQSLFANISGAIGSSIFLNGNLQITISESSFENNTALINSKSSFQGIAPCIYFSHMDDNIARNPKIFSSKFKNNFAHYIAGTIFSTISIYSYNNTFSNNSDNFNFTTQIFAFPLSIKSSNPPQMQNIASGIAFILQIQIVDSFNQTLVFDGKSIAIIKQDINLSVNQSLILENSLATSKSGVFTFPNLVIKTKPDTSFNLTVYVTFLGFSNPYQQNILIVNNSFLFSSRKCIFGEIRQLDNTCKLCPSGTYSLIDPMLISSKLQKCILCPPNAICQGGGSLYPQSGYFRKNNLSTNVLKCDSDACLGFFISGNNSIIKTFNDSLGFCMEGNSGVLCFYCEHQYGKYDKSSSCKKCLQQEIIVYLRMIFVVIFMIFYILINFRFAENTFEKKETIYSSFSTYFTIIINHCQQINFILVNISSFPLPAFSDLLFLSDYLSFSNDSIISNDCIMQKIYYDKLTNLIFKEILNIILPVLISAFSFIIWIFSVYVLSKFSRFSEYALKIPKKLSNLYANLFCFLALSVFLFYPLILKSCFSLFSCWVIDPTEGVAYLRESPELACWQKSHLKFVFLVGIPGIVFWGVIFPVCFFISLRRKLILIKKAERLGIYLLTNSYKKRFSKNCRASQQSHFILAAKKPIKVSFQTQKIKETEKQIEEINEIAETQQKIKENNENKETHENKEDSKSKITENKKENHKKEYKENNKEYNKVNNKENKKEYNKEYNKVDNKENNKVDNKGNKIKNNKENKIGNKKENKIENKIEIETIEIENNEEKDHKEQEAIIKFISSKKIPVPGRLSMLQKNDYLKESLQKLESSQMFLFFCKDYQPTYYYYGCIIFLRKFIFSFLTSMSDTLPEEIILFLLILLLFLSLMFTFILTPYKIKIANLAELLSLIVCVITLFCSAILNSDATQTGKMVWAVLCVFSNFLILGIIVIFSLWDFRKKYQKRRDSK